MLSSRKSPGADGGGNRPSSPRSPTHRLSPRFLSSEGSLTAGSLEAPIPSARRVKLMEAGENQPPRSSRGGGGGGSVPAAFLGEAAGPASGSETGRSARKSQDQAQANVTAVGRMATAIHRMRRLSAAHQAGLVGFNPKDGALPVSSSRHTARSGSSGRRRRSSATATPPPPKPKVYPPLSRIETLQASKAYDQQRANGLMDRESIRLLFCTVGENVSDDDLTSMLTEAGYKGDGHVLSFETFVKLLQMQKATYLINETNQNVDPTAVEAFTSLGAADIASDKIETSAILGAADEYGLTLNIEQFLEKLDPDGVGKLNFADFCELFDSGEDFPADVEATPGSGSTDSLDANAMGSDLSITQILDPKQLHLQPGSPTHDVARPTWAPKVPGFTFGGGNLLPGSPKGNASLANLTRLQTFTRANLMQRSIKNLNAGAGLSDPMRRLNLIMAKFQKEMQTLSTTAPAVVGAAGTGLLTSVESTAVSEQGPSTGASPVTPERRSPTPTSTSAEPPRTRIVAKAKPLLTPQQKMDLLLKRAGLSAETIKKRTTGVYVMASTRVVSRSGIKQERYISPTIPLHQLDKLGFTLPPERVVDGEEPRKSPKHRKHRVGAFGHQQQSSSTLETDGLKGASAVPVAAAETQPAAQVAGDTLHVAGYTTRPLSSNVPNSKANPTLQPSTFSRPPSASSILKSPTYSPPNENFSKKRNPYSPKRPHSAHGTYSMPIFDEDSKDENKLSPKARRRRRLLMMGFSKGVAGGTGSPAQPSRQATPSQPTPSSIQTTPPSVTVPGPQQQPAASVAAVWATPVIVSGPAPQVSPVPKLAASASAQRLALTNTGESRRGSSASIRPAAAASADHPPLAPPVDNFLMMTPQPLASSRQHPVQPFTPPIAWSSVGKDTPVGRACMAELLADRLANTLCNYRPGVS